MATIFVSYRRTDAPGHAGRLFDCLVDRFGDGNVFMDVDSMEPGADFVEVIQATVGRCDALIAVIGPDWLNAERDGLRRLDDPTDWVRLEIANALERDIRVIPVLVHGASMPAAPELPEQLRPFARRHGFQISDAAWRTQLEHLIDALERALQRGTTAEGPGLAAGGSGEPRLLHVLEGHESWVNGVAFSPDGQILASAGGHDGTVRLWDVASGRQTSILEGHVRGMRSVAFSPDGRIVAAGGGDGRVHIWDAARGMRTATFQAHADWARAVAFAPDRRVLASGGGDGAVRLWDADSLAPISTFEAHAEGVLGLAYSPDGCHLASAARGPVRLWDVAGGEPAATIAAHSGRVDALVFSPDGRVLASGGEEGYVHLSAVSDGERLAQLEGHTVAVRAVGFSPDGHVLASGGDDGPVRLWDAADGLQTAMLEGHDEVWAVAFSADGRLLASGGGDGEGGSLRLWSTGSA